MPAGDPVQILLAHNHWATRNILDACAALTDQQLDREFEMGVRTLRATMTHTVGAARRWCDMLVGREPRERIESLPPHSPVRLLELHDEVGAEILASAQTHPHEQIVSGVRGGVTYTFTRAAVLTHVTTHAMHHRAQALNMLRHLGVNPLPQSSVLEWVLAVDSAA